MESFNFGAFDTNLGARIAAIPQEAQKQQTANMLQAMQMQGAMRQNEMSQMQLDELKSDRAEMIKLQQELEAKGGSPDLGRLAIVLLKSPKHFKLGIELSQKLSAQTRFDKLNSGDALPPAPTEAPANMLPGVVSAPAGITNPPAAPQGQTTIANLNRQIAANMALGTDQGYKYAEMLQKRVDALSRRYTVGNTLMGVEGNIIGTAPQQPPEVARLIEYRKTLPEGSAEYIAVTDIIEKASNENYQFNSNTGRFELRQGGGAAPPPRAFVDRGIPQGVTPLLQAPSVDEARRQALAMNAAGLPVNIRGGNALAGAQPQPLAAAPPAVAAAAAPPSNPRQESQNYETTLKLEEAGYRRTPQGLEFIPGGKADPTVQAAQTTQKLSAKDLQKREAVHPQATAAVKGFETKADSFIKDLIALRDDVGLEQITGPIYGRIGSVSRAGSRAQAMYDKIVAKGGFQALQDLRDLSKTGGALGNVSNQEGKQLTASFAAIDQRQNASDVQAAINQAIADIEGARIRTREAYDSTYAYKTPADSAAPPTAPVDMPSAARAEIAKRAAAEAAAAARKKP